jgi:hypothetical protein
MMKARAKSHVPLRLQTVPVPEISKDSSSFRTPKALKSPIIAADDPTNQLPVEIHSKSKQQEAAIVLVPVQPNDKPVLPVEDQIKQASGLHIGDTVESRLPAPVSGVPTRRCAPLVASKVGVVDQDQRRKCLSGVGESFLVHFSHNK